MSARVLAMILVLAAAAGQALAVPSELTITRETRADENAHKISDAEKFMIELDDTLKLARAGDYGKISKPDLGRLSGARDSIAELLEGHDNARELKPDQRIELYDQQQLITSIIRDDEKNRRICKRVKATGTRLAKAECMTVAQRESRAREARYNVQQMQAGAACNVGTGPGKTPDCLPTFTGN